MSAFVLVTGTIFHKPEQRTAASGKPYVTAKIKAAAGNEIQFWSAVAFSEAAQAELLRLDEGDAVSVQGPCKIGSYQKDSATRISLSLTVEQVLPLRYSGSGHASGIDKVTGKPWAKTA